MFIYTNSPKLKDAEETSLSYFPVSSFRDEDKQKIVDLGNVHIERGKSRRNEKVKIYKGVLLNL